MNTYDLIIIGAGPGGYESAVHAAKSGMQVAIIEARKPGGTCLNEGCIPTKCLCHSAEILDEAKEGAALGITAENISFDLAQAIARKDEVVSKLIAGIESLMKTPGITYIAGKARFADKHTIAVETEQRELLMLEAPHIMIATGSSPKYLPIEGAHSPGVVSSTELLQMTTLPKRLCVIGGGVIGMEFASIFHSFGSQVEVVEYCKEILPNLDKDLAKRLRTSLKKKGIGFYLGAAVTRIEHQADGTSLVYFEEKGKEQSLCADVVLMAVGRTPNMSELCLEKAGVEYTPRGITVDADMRTNVPGVYAIGDVNGICPLAHAASFQGQRALLAIEGKDTSKISLDIIPSAVFTVPEFASVGLSEEACEAKGIKYTAHKAFYRANGKALALGADDGLAKILTDEDGKVLGCHILGAHSSDLVHEAALLMSLGGTLEQLTNTVHAHPTLSEILLEAARN